MANDPIKANIGTVTIDSDSDKLGDFVKRIANDAQFKASFQANPKQVFEDHGIQLPDDASARAAGQSLEKYIAQGGDPLNQVLPGGVQLPSGAGPGNHPQAGPAVVVVAAAAVAIASTPAVMAIGGVGGTPMTPPDDFTKAGLI